MRQASIIGFLLVFALSGCVSEGGTAGTSTASVATGAEQRDPIAGKWRVEPAVSTDSSSCTVTFNPISVGKTGRVNQFACHQVSGLGGLHGFADVNKWERKGDRIILSGIARPGIGTIYLPRDSGSRRAGGAMDDGVRFTLLRK